MLANYLSQQLALDACVSPDMERLAVLLYEQETVDGMQIEEIINKDEI